MANPVLDFSDLGAKLVAQQGQTTAPLDFSDLGGKRVETNGAPTATISARKPGALSWLEDLQDDIRHGNGTTWPGRLLKKMGAPGINTGVPESVGEFVGGPMIGPVNVAHGAGSMLSPASSLKQRVRGFNETVRGAGQMASPAIALAAPEFLPQVVPSAAVYGSAQQGVQKGAEAFGADPDTAEAVGNVATIAAPFVKAGMPRAGRFLERNAPRIGKVAGVGSAVAAGGEAAAKGYPWGAFPAAGAAYRYARPLATKMAQWSGRGMQWAGKTPLLPHELIDAPVAPRLVDQMRESGSLPPGQYEAPASPVGPQLQLGEGVHEGEYMEEPPPNIRGQLPRGAIRQPGGFEPNQPALPERASPIQLPAEFPAARQPIIRTTPSAPVPPAARLVDQIMQRTTEAEPYPRLINQISRPVTENPVVGSFVRAMDKSGMPIAERPNLLLKGSGRVNRILGPKEDLTDILSKSARTIRKQREQ